MTDRTKWNHMTVIYTRGMQTGAQESVQTGAKEEGVQGKKKGCAHPFLFFVCQQVCIN